MATKKSTKKKAKKSVKRRPRSAIETCEEELRAHALSYPETREDFPWGHSAIKVKDKAFVFMSTGKRDDGGLGISVKLPISNDAALMLPFASPTGYGLGKSGWVSADFAAGSSPPTSMLKQWIDESYRAVAPKKLVALVDGGAAVARKKEGATGRGRKKGR